MSLELSARIRAISPSPTLSIDAKTKALMAEGIDIINLSVGEPDFNTPDQASLAGIAAIVANFTKYTPVPGILELRKAISAKLLNENELTYAADEILVSSGAKHSLYNVFMAILNPGDEVLLPTPYWVTYPEQIRLCDGIPVPLPTDERTGFRVTPEQLRKAITKKTRAFLLNSPSNPTGAVYTQEQIQELAAVLEEHDIYVVSDEIYEQLTYGVQHYSIARYSEKMRNRTLVVNGFSKTHAMTGWRVGYVAGPKPIINAMTSLQSQTTANAASISQKAALGALGTFDHQHVVEFQARRDFVLQRLAELPDLTCAKPDGAFYVFPNAKKWLGKTYSREDNTQITIDSTDQLAELLLTDANIAVVPGGGFGAPDNFRISYATSMEKLRKGMDRLTAFAKRLK